MESDLLSTEIEEQEFLNSLSNLKNKSPGPDCISYQPNDSKSPSKL